eukprot:1288061-Pyramimonas_sp.AAC.1
MLSGSSTCPPAVTKVDGLPPAPSFNRPKVTKRSVEIFLANWLSNATELLLSFQHNLLREALRVTSSTPRRNSSDELYE